jgi:hypothetical protein
VNSTLHHNSPIKNCQTCAHCVRDTAGPEYNHCSRFGFYCVIAIRRLCQTNYWQPKPPKPKRRSLRQWLRDLLWA